MYICTLKFSPAHVILKHTMSNILLRWGRGGGGNQPPYRSIICYISFILCSVVLILTRFKQLGISRLSLIQPNTLEIFTCGSRDNKNKVAAAAVESIVTYSLRNSKMRLQYMYISIAETKD